MVSVFRLWQRLTRNVALFGMIATICVGIAVLTQHKAIADAPVDQGKPWRGSHVACQVCGGWSVNVTTVVNPSSVNKVLTTFSAGGAIAEIDETTSRTGLGSWAYSGDDHHNVTYTYLKQQIGANGYTGMIQVTFYVVLNETFDEYSGYSNVTTFAVDGSVAQLERIAEIHGFRIQVDVPVGTKAAPNIP